MFAIIRKINAGMKKIEEFIVGYGTIALAVLIIANVIGRNVFGYSLYFVEETNTFFDHIYYICWNQLCCQEWQAYQDVCFIRFSSKEI